MRTETAYITRDVEPGKGGRMHFRSTEWGAISVDNSFIAKGTIVCPISRIGNSWIVTVDEGYLAEKAA